MKHPASVSDLNFLPGPTSRTSDVLSRGLGRTFADDRLKDSWAAAVPSVTLPAAIARPARAPRRGMRGFGVRAGGAVPLGRSVILRILDLSPTSSRGRARE